MLLTFLHWLGASGAGKALAASTALYAATQSLHLLALAGLGGASIAIALTALGVIFRPIGVLPIARGLSPLLFSALGLMAISGLLLVAAGPSKYFYNPLFPWKLIALAIALAIQVAIYPGLALLGANTNAPVARLLGAVSLVAWAAVTVIGRWVGLI